MGVYAEYLDQRLNAEALAAERRRLLSEISRLRGGRDVLVFASDLNKSGAPISISYADLLPIQDQLANLKGTSCDLILETPGGSGEVAEDIVRQLHERYKDGELGVIVPGWAKSAGTLIAMAGDEILMGPGSALGPIDAQLNWQGKTFSADALLAGLDKIKSEVAQAGTLNRAYIPILQALSPGELQSAQNALDFAKVLVRDWLATYKFKNWTVHRSTGTPVTKDEKTTRADEIAKDLCDHGKWKTHGRSLRLTDLETMRLRITNLADSPELLDAITRYHTLLQMTFASNIYKIFETPTSQIVRFMVPQGPPPPANPVPKSVAEKIIVEAVCGRCQRASKIQGNLGSLFPLDPGCLPFPPDNRFICPGCKAESDLGDLRRQVEAQSGKRVVG